ncbi:TRAP transporter permease [Haloglomus litoreum]|uniref:TRAP transporter permease n=1 Tax=Haloglomus litoreum TaxID=3034026 RepID=UPI0023E7B0BE|nr:TRAP transporter permease [Haloglomus sp. DT116]
MTDDSDDHSDEAESPAPDPEDGSDADPAEPFGSAATPTEQEGLSEADQEELIKELESRRTLTGIFAVGVAVVGIVFSVFQIWLAARGFEFVFTLPFVGEVVIAKLQQLQINAFHVTFALVLAFALYPPTTGDGFLSRRLARVVPGLRERFGEGSPVTVAAERLRAVVRWGFVDAKMERITPFDFVLMFGILTASYYYLNEFEEILRLRALGLDAGRSFGEIYTVLAPLESVLTVVLPFADASFAYLLGVVAFLLVLEATRRTLGLPLVVIVGSFIVYAKYGYLIPLDAPYIGVLSTSEGSWSTIVTNLWYTDQGILGVPVLVSVQFIYIFILFGAFLEASGAGQWFIDLAYAATGRRKGGPAKASILASGFMGTISGSSIANTVTTGAFTIPLMKRSGYRAEFAGGVEASASSGGQILPPVMGAAAFLIVEFTGIPYAEVIIAAAIPAVVFFFGVWVMVHLEASRAGIGGLDDVALVDVRDHLSTGWFYLVPLGLLLFYLLVERLTVARSAYFSLLAIVALIAIVASYDPEDRAILAAALISLVALRAGLAFLGGNPVLATVLGSLGWLVLGAGVVTMLVYPRGEAPLLEYDDAVDRTAERMGRGLNREDALRSRPGRFLAFITQSLDGGARTATPVVVAVAAAGIIPGVVATTGLGPNLTALIVDIAGGSLVLLLVVTAISCIILGMGMPTTVTYIILISMLGPALTQLGIPRLVSDLFILYFGVIADITPPVAVAAYAASGVAQSDPFKTGLSAFSLSLNKAIVPFAFVFTPGLLLLRIVDGSPEIVSVADLTTPSFVIPEVLVPVLGVFLGVVALAATVIGFLYAKLDTLTRAGFAVAALFLMAPGLVLTPLGLDTLTIDLGSRIAGAVLFAALAFFNRVEAGAQAEPAGAG